MKLAADRLAHSTVGAIGPDQIPGAYLSNLAGPNPSPGRFLLAAVRGEDDVVTTVLHRPDLPAGEHLDRWHVPHLTVQDALELGLGEEVGRRPALQPGAGPIDLQQRLAVTVAPLIEIGHGIGDRQDLIPQTGGLEESADLVIEVHAPRQVVDVEPPLEHSDAIAEPAEQDRQQLTRRAVPDDRHVKVALRTHRVTPHVPRSAESAGRAAPRTGTRRRRRGGGVPVRLRPRRAPRRRAPGRSTPRSDSRRTGARCS